MSSLATTKLSSRGQVVIPEEIREKMHLHTGDQFIVIAEKDVVILKVITQPNINDYDHLISSIRNKTQELGLNERAVQEAIKEARTK